MDQQLQKLFSEIDAYAELFKKRGAIKHGVSLKDTAVGIFALSVPLSVKIKCMQKLKKGAAIELKALSPHIEKKTDGTRNLVLSSTPDQLQQLQQLLQDPSVIEHFKNIDITGFDPSKLPDLSDETGSQ